VKAITPLLLGVFFVLATLIWAAACISLITPGAPLDALWALKPAAREDMMLLRPASTGGFAILAAAMGMAAFGVLRRRRWGRALAVLIFALNALGAAIAALQGEAAPGIAGVAIDGAIIWWITRPRVKALFS
jgi:hypothetical protein